MTKIRWGIIGLGHMANVFAQSISQLDNSTLLAISSKNPDRLKNFSRKYHFDDRYCFRSYETLLSCKEIDIVYVALPNSYHHEWIVKCIEAGKHILVEKPATTNSRELQIVQEKLRSKSLIFNEGFMYLHHPQTIKLVNLLKSDLFGEPIEMETVFGGKVIGDDNLLQKLKNRLKPEPRLFNKSLGGGCILDLGCYLTSLSQIVAKIKSDHPVNSVTLENTKHVFDSKKVEIEASTELSFENGFQSRIQCSFKRELGQRTKIMGTKGKVIVESTWSCESDGIFFNGEKLNTEDLKFDNPYSYQISNISNWILQGIETPKYPSLTLADSLNNMRILDKWRSPVSL